MSMSNGRHPSRFERLRTFLRANERAVKAPISRFFWYQRLSQAGFVADFPHEGNIKIHLPKLSAFNAFFDRNKLLTRSFKYYVRKNSEPLLRKIIFDFYSKGIIDRGNCVVDIGCWIADNTLVWAQLLRNDAVVFAIDPSAENLAFGRDLADRNNVTNIKWVEAVCSDEPGISLGFDGSLDHAVFSDEEARKNSLLSTTLDDIVGDRTDKIGLLHVDVEGFETKVLRGARRIILESKPVITFERHISKDDVSQMTDELRGYGYRVYMVNEVMPRCSLDCRNFVALHSDHPEIQAERIDQTHGRRSGIYYATIGPNLIELT